MSDSAIPAYLQRLVTEEGTRSEELLLCLVQAVEHNNDKMDYINMTLQEIRDEMHRESRSRTAEVREVVAALRFIGNNV